MHNLCGFLSHTYCRIKALGITFLVLSPFIWIYWKIFLSFLGDIFYNMIILQFAAVSWILSHSTWFSLKGCPICNGNVPIGIFKTNYWNVWQCQQCLCLILIWKSSNLKRGNVFHFQHLYNLEFRDTLQNFIFLSWQIIVQFL